MLLGTFVPMDYTCSNLVEDQNYSQNVMRPSLGNCLLIQIMNSIP